MLAARSTLLALSLAACTPASAPVETVEAVAVETPPPAPSVRDVPAEPAPPPIVAPPEPVPSIAASKRFPKNVYAALVSGWEQHEWTVDIVDTEVKEGSELDLAIDALADAHAGSPAAEDGYFEHAELPAGHVAIPKGWKVGDTWTLMTRAGTVTRKVKGFAITIPGGTGTYHFEVRLGPAPKDAKGPALAVRGTGEAPTVVEPVPVALAELGEGAFAKIVAAAGHRVAPELRATLRKHPPQESHVKVYAGRFPGGRTHAIFLSMEGGEEEVPFAALLFAKADGTIERFEVSDVQGEMAAFAIVDLDGDGFDEIAYEDWYHEGSYLELLYWKGERPKTRLLTGDGL